MCSLRVVFVFLLGTLGKNNAALQDNETGEVIFVNLLHRHGDRAPASFYPNDPYQNMSYWPEGFGQLTNVGKRQMFELGQWLRGRYDSLLTNRYSADLIYIRSTDRDRTLMSADVVQAGMFPPEGGQVWKDDLAWQPVPVHTMPVMLDKVLGQPPRTPCPAYNQELQRVFTTDEQVRELNQTYADLFQRIYENTGVRYSLLTLYLMYDPLFVESLNNLTLPEWTKGVYPQPMYEANVYGYRLITWTTKLARLTTGLLIKDMIQNMVNKVQNKTTRNVQVYSGHDETLVNFLAALGAFNNLLPPYATCLMVELRVDSGGNHYVSLYYRNSTTDGPHLLTVKGCTPMCPLNTFINISDPLIPRDWDQECMVVPDDDHSSYFWIVLLIIGIVIAVILASLVLYYYYNRRKSFG